MRLFYTLILVLGLVGCNGCSDLTKPVNGRPAPVTQDIELCVQAQDHLLELKCQIAQPTKKGLTFSEFCKQTQQAGIFINPKCLSQVSTCDTDVCTRSK